jgi:hypothetical protein
MLLHKFNILALINILGSYGLGGICSDENNEENKR